ncbi:magnesium-protoporphyrin IX monomethyl ester anaerobic oxidative cyclase [Phormidesmis priestleyi ULC007]|uniref:Magnesium-protoporphyrin IX monomethyl ester anaerobic oxidative cyclase n=1 Tax=Phormidesmis priestleyi ULC007 TaxID=1920490 RepID=A0A2T1D9T5_9CYAN|nr:magnesium-protoporphyrin IX monomethyl ester anaerobic oxidative cyclase [Phormidesmis priestleyi]PSB17269.1 magnesium-protoporphyrin IX monomethyl ester anaerobic oxidative cyclase [Phormidesmis priestleyi ULC007]PZO48058.1 MAG: magnesium-protoporphyrin IX monomethyl ester anaerobic oxidative cyclase [Phormidesmis priestleyi]
MRILMIQPNYHSGGAEIAGNWPPSWVPYVGGALKTAGFNEVRFVDAMTNYIADADLAEIIRDYQPHVVLATAITPMIYQSQRTLKLVKEVCPDAKTIMGGVHPTYMYREVLNEAAWIDYIIRGEGEEITVNLLRAIAAGTDERDRREILGLAFLENGKVVATPAHPPIKDLNTLTPDWTLLNWPTYLYTPLNVRVAVPNYSRGCPFRCRFCSQWKFWRKYRSRSPKHFVDEIERLVKDHQIGFFILADEEPTINKSRFVALCNELVDRNLGVHWGINTRVTDILRDEKELPLYRQAGLVHVSLGTEAAAQLNLNLFRKETTIADNKRAVQLLRDHGILAEVQFIMGLPSETPETIEETYRMARDWKADMTNWNMYTPWPFSELFQDLQDKVEIRDYSHYNFVTPIIKPDHMTREGVLKGVLRNYARFYSWKFLEYWFEPDPFKRRYLLGCLWAFVKTTLNKRFYNLSRVKQKGLHTEIEFGFDESKILSAEQMAQFKQPSADIDSLGTISACGGPNESSETSNYPKVQKPDDIIQVAVIEADEQTRVNLRVDLRAQEGIEVASEATNAETGIVLLESIDVDVAVVDSTLPDMDLVKFIRMARKAQANSYVIPSKILVLVPPGNLSVVSDAIAAGADAISLKGAPIEQLANAVRITHRNGMYQDPAIASLLEPAVTAWSLEN